MAKKRKVDVTKGVVVATIVAILGLTIAVGYFLGGDKLVVALFDKEEDRAYYFITTAGIDDVTIAHQNADLIRLRGGAGYVDMRADNSIVLAVYPDKNSAENVLVKLGDNSLVVREIPMKAVSVSLKDKGLRNAVNEALTYFDLTFDTLYNLSNSLADNEVTVDDVKIQIGVLSSKIEDIKSVFYEKTKNSSLDEITEIKLALVTALAIIDGVETGNTAKTLSSLRRQTVQLVYCHQALALTLS